MELKPQTLMVAIQCVATEIRRLDQQLDDDTAENPAAIEQLLVSFDLAADELKIAYEATLDQFGNLPPYNELIKQQNT